MKLFHTHYSDKVQKMFNKIIRSVCPNNFHNCLRAAFSKMALKRNMRNVQRVELYFYITRTKSLWIILEVKASVIDTLSSIMVGIRAFMFVWDHNSSMTCKKSKINWINDNTTIYETTFFNQLSFFIYHSSDWNEYYCSIK